MRAPAFLAVLALALALPGCARREAAYWGAVSGTVGHIVTADARSRPLPDPVLKTANRASPARHAAAPVNPDPPAERRP
jgi:hypothetical protein